MIYSTRGLSLIEAVIAMAILAIVTGVIVGLLAASEKTYTYAMRQTSVLTGARQALEGGGNPHGLVWEIRQALSVNALSATSLTVTAPDASAPQFSLSGHTLQTTQQGSTRPLAQNVNSLQLNYYTFNSSG